MYIPKHFQVTDLNEIFAFAEAHAFGQLISQVDGRPFSSHLPFLIGEDRTTILAHVALANPQYKSIEGQEVLITLDGPHDYISPSWYARTGVPTWNYQTVHIYGHCQTFNEPERLKQVVDGLTRKYEAGLANPWQPDYQASMLRGIVGLEISVTEVLCKYKLSQNKSAADQALVIEQLREVGSSELADVMEKHYSKGHPEAKLKDL